MGERKGGWMGEMMDGREGGRKENEWGRSDRLMGGKMGSWMNGMGDG